MDNTLLSTLEIIENIIGDFFITGSLALTYTNPPIIKRKVGDLDLIVDNREAFVKIAKLYPVNLFFKYREIRKNPLNQTRVLQKALCENTKAIQFYIGEVKVDVFFMDNNFSFFTKKIFGDKAYKITSPEVSINAKQSFIDMYDKTGVNSQKQLDSYNKHLKDIKAYEDWQNEYITKTVFNNN